jgi:ribosome-associated protein
MRDVEITREPIELFKLLKFEGISASGGVAKHMIADGQVKVNGTVEIRKRRKIVNGDVVKCGNETLKIQLVDKPPAST